jgi:uncharacterized protein
MTTLVWSGIVVGFLGSLHCLGMCGPIALALPTGHASKTSLFFGRLTYNFGRTVTYALLGAVSGLVGKSIELAGLQQSISIGAGVLILLGVLLPTRFFRGLLPKISLAGPLDKIKAYWQVLFTRQNKRSLFVLGVLNGFLPCGFLYLGLVTAATMGGVLAASLYMILFGLGTTPVLLLTSFAGGLFSMQARRKILRLAPVAVSVLAVVLIVRGLSLGIPYLSPNVHHSQATMEHHSCCE